MRVTRKLLNNSTSQYLFLSAIVYKIKEIKDFIDMRHNKTFLFAVLPALAISLLTGCNKQKEESSKEEPISSQPSSSSEAPSSVNTSSSSEESSKEESIISEISSTTSSIESTTVVPSSSEESSEEVPTSSSSIEEQSEEEEQEHNYEIGDVTKEWNSRDDYDKVPFGIGGGSGTVEIFDGDIGMYDDCSIYVNAQVGRNSLGYITSDAVEEPYFTEEDAKNGDLISLYVYIPSDGNVSSIQLQIYSTNNGDFVEGEKVKITEDDTDKWVGLTQSFDSIYTLGSIRVYFEVVDVLEEVNFYVDDIEITLEEETVQTEYEYNDESLWQTYEDYFKVGTCMPGDGLRNTELRKIAKDNFNSITAENEGKPERILDQAACQELAKTDNSAVAITTAPFEKIYDFCAANNIGVRHHTFVWYSQTPSWFFNVDYTNNGQRADRVLMLTRMENFIQVTLNTINERWPGLVYAIDVSNEAIDNGGIRSNNNNWYTTVGEDFVYYSFLFASMYKEDYQKLYYNDYSFDYNVDNCRFAVNTLLKDAIEEGLVDGVGIQGHIDSNANLDVLINDAKLIYEKGLECQITELDITVNGSDDNSWQSQKNAYKNLVKKIITANENGDTDINAVILWGITDNSSWKRNQNPLLFNSSYAKKPCYYGFLEAIDELE